MYSERDVDEEVRGYRASERAVVKGTAKRDKQDLHALLVGPTCTGNQSVGHIPLETAKASSSSK